MILTSKLKQYNTRDIIRLFDTKISELSNSGEYDYIVDPAYIDVSILNTNGVVWKNGVYDKLIINWSYIEPLGDLIPLSDIYLINGNDSILLKSGILTDLKNISIDIPDNITYINQYYIKITSKYNSNDISYNSSKFKFDGRTLNDVKTNVSNVIANMNNTIQITWKGNGLSDVFDIDVLSSMDGIESTYKLLKTIQSNYNSTEYKYVWLVNDIEYLYDKLNVKIRITDTKNNIISTSDVIKMTFPYIEFINKIGTIYHDSIEEDTEDDIIVVEDPDDDIEDSDDDIEDPEEDIIEENIPTPVEIKLLPDETTLTVECDFVEADEKNADTSTEITIRQHDLVLEYGDIDSGQYGITIYPYINDSEFYDKTKLICKISSKQDLQNYVIKLNKSLTFQISNQSVSKFIFKEGDNVIIDYPNITQVAQLGTNLLYEGVPYYYDHVSPKAPLYIYIQFKKFIKLTSNDYK